MKIENPLIYLQRHSKFENGDRLRIKFKIPEINDDKYGSGIRLEGEIPLLFKQGEHLSSKFYELSESEQLSFIKKHSAFVQTVHEDLEDSELFNCTLFHILIIVNLSPTLDIHSSEFENAIKASVLVFVSDDVADSEDFYEGFDISKTGRKVTKAIEKVQDGDLEGLSILARLAPTLQSFTDLLIEICNEKEKLVPGYTKSKYWVFTSFLDTILTHVMLFTKSYIPDTITRMILEGYNKAVDNVLESEAVRQEIRVKRNIRETALFKQLYDSFNLITAGLNDVRGLVKDIQKAEVLDSSILSQINETKDLKTAYEEVMIIVHQRYKMVESYSDLLEKCFSNDQDLKKYLHLLKQHLDGQALAYFGFENVKSSHKYGGGWVTYIDKA